MVELLDNWLEEKRDDCLVNWKVEMLDLRLGLLMDLKKDDVLDVPMAL
jgi:hypothetical protein